MHGIADDDVFRYGSTLVVSPHTARMLVHDYNPHDELDAVRTFHEGQIDRRFRSLALRFGSDTADRRTIVEDTVRRALGDDWRLWSRPIGEAAAREVIAEQEALFEPYSNHGYGIAIDLDVDAHR